MTKINNLIGGEWIAPVSGAYADNINPASNKVLASVADSDSLDIVYAIQAAKKALPKWSALPLKERADYILKIADQLESIFDELALAETNDVGKPLWLSKAVDIPRAIEALRYFCELALNESALEWTESQTHQEVYRSAVGVCALITPWNMPLYLLCWKLAPALIMGNTVICKPSELTPMTASLLGRVVKEVGVPEGVVNIVFGKGEAVGETLVKHPSVSLVSFTGSSETGSIILKNSADKVAKVSLELGGKNANIVLADADIDLAVEKSIKAAFLNSGQICLCGSRLFISEKIYDEFMKKFVAEAKKLIVSDPIHKETFMGPVISAEHKQNILKDLKQIESDNGDILCINEEFNHDNYLSPYIVTDLTDCSELWQKEIFGPVVLVRSFKYNHEAVKWANTSPYGLSASIFSGDMEKAKKMALKIEAGTVWINTWGERDARVPFGGVKQSGLGREGGLDSLNFYSERKLVFSRGSS